MTRPLIAIASLLFGVGLLQLGTGLFGTFLGLRMDLEGFSEIAIGLVGSAYFGGFILGALYVEQLVPQVGHIRAFATFAAALCAATLLQALWVDLVQWAAMRFIMGLSMAALFVITESWINERAGNEVRGQVFAVYMTVNYLCLGGGQFLVGSGPMETAHHFIIAAVLFSISLIPVALTRSQTPPPGEGHRFSMRQLYKISPMGVVGCLVVGLSSGAFYALAPVFAQRAGYPTEGVALFMGSAILCGLLLQWPFGKLSDLFDRRTILIVLAFLTAGLAVAIGGLGPHLGLWVLLLLTGLFGGTNFTLYPVSVAHANDHLDPADLVPASAGLIISFGLGAAVGPLAAAAVMKAVGAAGLFYFIGAAAACLGIYGIHRTRVRPAPAIEEQGRFVAMPRTSPVVMGLDPRVEPEQPSFDFDAPPEAPEQRAEG